MIAYTIVSQAYVPHARVLARSYARHHGGEKLWALLIDDVDGRIVESDEPFNVLRLGDLDLDQREIHRMAMLFGGKLIAVIKPWVFDHFLGRGADSVLYIDGDFEIFDSLGGVAENDGGGVILIPHLLHPLPRDGKNPDETELMGAGMFNAGMFGTGPEHGGFIGFLQERLQRECIFDARSMRFNEQRWLDFVPSLFPHRIVRDPGIDVAYWNLHERPLERRSGEWFAGGSKLKAFHFSSFDPRVASAGGRFELSPSPRVRVSENPGFKELCELYGEELYLNGFSELHDVPFSFDTLADGSMVYESLRTLFTDAVLAADQGTQSYPPDPFDPSESTAFRAWFEDQYARAGLALPRGLQQASEPARVFSRLRRAPRAHRGSEKGLAVRWSVDWLNRMIVDEAAEQTPLGLQVMPERVGFVCHGPRAPQGSGKYRATLEWDSDRSNAADPEGIQAVVVEAFVRGYVVGSRSVGLQEIGTGAVVLDIEIPRRYQEDALLFGVELRVLTRGGVNARLTAVVFEALGRVEDQVDVTTLDVDWLPVMAGGNAGIRCGSELVTMSEKVGVVVSGPNWRLDPGVYAVEMGTRLLAPTGHCVDGETVAELEVSCGTRILLNLPLTRDDLAQGTTRGSFTLAESDAGPNAQVGVSVRTLVPLEAAVTSMFVRSIGSELSKATVVA